MRKLFYFRLALSNVRRNKLTYIPYLVATAAMSGVFLLISGLLFSDGLTNTPPFQYAAQNALDQLDIFGDLGLEDRPRCVLRDWRAKLTYDYQELLRGGTGAA